MLAVASRFKWVQINYLAALGQHFDVYVASSGEGGLGAAQDGLREGLRGEAVGAIREVGAAEVRSRLKAVISRWQPDLVHVMYYNHDELTLMVRDIVGDDVPVVYECRDPQSTLSGAGPESAVWERERAALCASDRQIFVSQALRRYLERGHRLDLRPTSLLVPQGFGRATIAPPSPKLSAGDGRLHVALVGTADEEPDHGRWYGDIIRRLVGSGLVVHSHFWELEGRSLEPYRVLARELEDYHLHPTVGYRNSTALSKLISRYDLMGVFHELGAAHHNESATLAVCLPTKAVCGWLHGGIPVVCFPHYGGVVERIEALGIGFVVEEVEDVARIAADRTAIEQATERCLASRDRFTNEHNAGRIRSFVDPVLGGSPQAASASVTSARRCATLERGATTRSQSPQGR
jgi:hypothetical protein